MRNAIVSSLASMKVFSWIMSVGTRPRPSSSPFTKLNASDPPAGPCTQLTSSSTRLLVLVEIRFSWRFVILAHSVIAVECDAANVIELARHNANCVRRRTSHRVCVCGLCRIVGIDPSWPRLAPHEALTAVFLSPPWGGPGAVMVERYSLDCIVLDGDHSFVDVFQRVRVRLSRNIALFLPRNVDADELVALAGTGNIAELESHRLSNKLKAVTVYFGGLVDRELLMSDLDR
jgi:hypothetical protein